MSGAVPSHVERAGLRSGEEAEAIAHRVSGKSGAARIVRATKGYYAVLDDHCLVIVGADASMPEVLGYSSHVPSDLAESADEIVLPPALEEWLKQYGEAPLFRDEVADECAPLIQSQWNQGTPYNLLAPKYNSVNHCPTGCTATAMAQLMYKHRHPERGIGSHSYEWTCGDNAALRRTLSADFGNTEYRWDQMLPAYTGIAHTGIQDTAVATLMYHCGVAIEMIYGSDASSGTDRNVLTGLFTYFDYDHNIRMLPKNFYRIEELTELVRDELRAGRPVYVSGQGSGGGHAFICDGFSQDGYFHFNWGWGGLADGYYLMTGLNPAEQGTGGNLNRDYNSEVLFAIGIRPSTGSLDTIYDLSVSQVSLLFETTQLGKKNNARLVTVKNQGLHPFAGQYAIGLLNANEELLEVLTTPYRINNPLPGTHYYTSPLSFSITFPTSLQEGLYQVCGLYRKSDESEWQVMRELGGGHLTQVSVQGNTVTVREEENESPVSLSINELTCPVQEIARTATLTVSAVQVMNTGNETFSGHLGIVLLDKDTKLIKHVIYEHPSDIPSLMPNYYFSNPVQFTFTIPTEVDEEEIENGVYYLGCAHHQVHCQWKPVERNAASNGKILLKLHIKSNKITIEPSDENPNMDVEEVPSDQVQSTKIIRNGILYIERNGKTFNATGAQIK